MADQITTSDSAKLPPLTPSAALRWDVVARQLPRQLGAALEIGCGRGAAATRLAGRAASLTAIEPDAQSFASASKALEGRATVRNIDSTVLEQEGAFDTVCAFEVLEHIEDDKAALAQWLSLLKPGGTLALSVPAHADRMGAADRMVGHFRRYDPAVLEARLAEVGFTDIRVTLYGYPAGLALEGVRNFLAQRRLRRADANSDYATRTAASGRFLQPHRGITGAVAALASMPMIALQRVFPNRGPGLVAIARRAQ